MNIRIVSPSGFCSAAIIDRGAEILRSWGHNVTIGEHAKGKYGRFGGTPEERAKDIIAALEDPTVDILYASRGGYGTVHLLDKLPLQLIKEAKKPIFGYSDITALHALWQKAGVRSVHAHMMKHLGNFPEHPTTLAIKDILENWNNEPKENKALEEALGTKFDVPLIGGNLTVISALHCAPNLDFDYDGKILFIEDINEPPYKIDSMIQQLKYSGILAKIKGLIVGQFTSCEEDPEMPKDIYGTIKETVKPYGIPMWFGAPIGHVENNIPIIEGL